MASIIVSFSGHWNVSDFGFGVGTGARAIDPRQNLLGLDGLLWALATGSQSGTYDVAASTTNAVKASSDVTATTSGALGVVVNGTTVSTNFNTSQDQTASDAVTNINANTTVNKLVTATKGATGHLTVTANVAGEIGNACTLTVTGTGASATGSGKLASGAGGAQPTTYTLT